MKALHCEWANVAILGLWSEDLGAANGGRRRRELALAREPDGPLGSRLQDILALASFAVKKYSGNGQYSLLL
jgi:hypothetical protein